MYEIINVVYGVACNKDQEDLIEEHYGDWPEHLGDQPYTGVNSPSGYIGAPISEHGVFELHGKPISHLSSVLIDAEMREKVKEQCDEIRLVVKGCEDFPEPALVFSHSTS